MAPLLGSKEIRHAYSRKYSRLTHLDALLTLDASYSLFSQSPVEKQHSVVFLGRLPTSLCSFAKKRVAVNRDEADRTLTKEPTKKAGHLTCFFRWAHSTKMQLKHFQYVTVFFPRSPIY